MACTKMTKCPNDNILIGFLLLKEIQISILGFFCRSHMVIFALKIYTTNYYVYNMRELFQFY
jgi:hypothetical protein